MAIGLIILSILTSGDFRATFDLQTVLYLRGDLRLGTGSIIDVFEVSSSDDCEPLVGYDYVFNSPIGDLTWTSYNYGYDYNIGDKVRVEYNPERPYAHRIQGMHTIRDELILVMFLIAAAWIFYNFLNGRKKNRIIKNGVLTTGKLIDKQITLFTLNGRKQFRMTFSYTTNDQEQHEVTTKTFEPSFLEDEKGEMIIYQTDAPHRAIVLDAIP